MIVGTPFGPPVQVAEASSTTSQKGQQQSGDMFDSLVGPITAARREAARNQEVRDAEGRQRFHGAFTGGFSAGYYNTVGSKEGWTPSTFVSRRDGGQMQPQRIQDFMDEEDDALLGSALGAARQFDTHGRQALRDELRVAAAAAGASGEGSTGSSGSLFSGAVPAELLVLRDLPVGVQMLQGMGWRKGLPLGPRHVVELAATLVSSSGSCSAACSTLEAACAAAAQDTEQEIQEMLQDYGGAAGHGRVQYHYGLRYEPSTLHDELAAASSRHLQLLGDGTMNANAAFSLIDQERGGSRDKLTMLALPSAGGDTDMEAEGLEALAPAAKRRRLLPMVAAADGSTSERGLLSKGYLSLQNTSSSNSGRTSSNDERRRAGGTSSSSRLLTFHDEDEDLAYGVAPLSSYDIRRTRTEEAKVQKQLALQDAQSSSTGELAAGRPHGGSGRLLLTGATGGASTRGPSASHSVPGASTSTRPAADIEAPQLSYDGRPALPGFCVSGNVVSYQTEASSELEALKQQPLLGLRQLLLQQTAEGGNPAVSESAEKQRLLTARLPPSVRFPPPLVPPSWQPQHKWSLQEQQELEIARSCVRPGSTANQPVPTPSAPQQARPAVEQTQSRPAQPTAAPAWLLESKFVSAGKNTVVDALPASAALRPGLRTQAEGGERPVFVDVAEYAFMGTSLDAAAGSAVAVARASLPIAGSTPSSAAPPASSLYGPAKPSSLPTLQQKGPVRRVVAWVPAPLLLKRFNVPDPYTKQEREELQGTAVAAAGAAAGAAAEAATRAHRQGSTDKSAGSHIWKF